MRENCNPKKNNQRHRTSIKRFNPNLKCLAGGDEKLTRHTFGLSTWAESYGNTNEKFDSFIAIKCIEDSVTITCSGKILVGR